MNPTTALEDMRTITRLLTDAERIARELGDEEPAAEHLLLSAIGLPDGSAARALGRVGVDAGRIRRGLREELADALVTAGVPRETAEASAQPLPLPAGGAALLYAAGPSAREVFAEAGRIARASKQRLVGAHVVVAAAILERGTLPRVFERLGVDPDRLADAARAELGGRSSR
jgi:ATP-dependent Clp protease ATP-binding subunit ClpA